MEETLSKFMSEWAKVHEENSNMIKEIRASTDVVVRNQGASIKTLEIQIGKISKVLQERGFRSLPSSIEANLRDHVKSISTNVKADSNPIHFIILDMPEDVKVPLIIGRPFLSTAHAKIDVFKRKITLRKDQVDDLIPTIEEGEFYNSIMRDKVEHKGKNVVRAFMNVSIFVKKISVVTHFVVVENMDGYQDQDMGDITLGEPFCKASCVEARRFGGLITIHNGCDNVTYQMVRSHPRFKHLFNAQCNKIKPLLKVSVHDKLSGISHPYQKLKSFYKGVLNLGPEYVRDTKLEEWLTHAHISVHEME
ncbi:homeodomain-like protein [Tanacetum coccineum]